MVANIVEILPGVSIPGAVSSAVLGIQAVTLDIAGFGLASMSEHAKRCGNLAAARKGSITGYCLIGLMLLTLLVVSIGHLWPVTLPVVAIIEKILLLVRVLMTVIYGHVIHGLRASHATQNTTGNPPINTTQNTTTNTTHNPPINTTGNTTQNTPNGATNGGKKSANAPAKNPPTNTTQKPPNGATKTRQGSRQSGTTKDKVLSYRRRHPDASQSDIARALNVSIRSVQRHDSKAAEQEQRLHVVQ